MKRIIFAAASWVACISAFAQGTLNFANSAPDVNAPVFECDGVTRLWGETWVADLYWAPGVVTDSSLLSAFGLPASFSTTAPGYFFGGTRTIPDQAGGDTITAQVRVWDNAFGSTWANAGWNGGAVGESVLFQVTLTASNQIPANLVGLNDHPFVTRLLALTLYSRLDFANYGPGVNAPVTDGYGHAINGPGFVADLYWAPYMVTDSTVLTAFGRPAPFSTNGYFFGGVRSLIVGPCGGSPFTFQVRVWDVASGGSWDEASASSHPGFLAASPLSYGTLYPNSRYPLGLQPFASRICQTCPSVIPGGIPLTVHSGGTNYLLFSWPWFHPYSSESEFRQYVALQENPDLNPTNWLTLPDNPWLVGLTNGIQYQLLIPTPSVTMFYRLRWQ